MERAKKKRAALLTAGTLGIAAALTLVLIHTTDNAPDHQNNRPTTARKVPVSYTVNGTGPAHITYTRADGTHTTTVTAHLPWHHTTNVTAGQAPATVSIVLGQDGGHATCTLTLNGHPVQHATAHGTFGRATCTAPPTTPGQPATNEGDNGGGHA